MVQGVQTAIDRYNPDGIPVAFDLQIEAEVLGCDLVWADETPPAVQSHPLSNGRKLEDLKIPGPDEGRIKTVLAVASRLCKANPDVAFYGLVTGPFTLALHLMGTDIFMKMFDDANYVRKVMGFCRDVCCAMADYFIDAGCEFVGMVDPMTSQIGPDQFRDFVTPYVTPRLRPRAVARRHVVVLRLRPCPEEHHGHVRLPTRQHLGRTRTSRCNTCVTCACRAASASAGTCS